MVIPEGYIYLQPGDMAMPTSGIAVSKQDITHVVSSVEANSHSPSSRHSSMAMGLFPFYILLTRERPNTDASFSVSVGTDILQPSVANVLHPHAIADLLSSYPNQRFVDALISIATHGARLGFEGTAASSRARQPNHVSATAHPDVVSNAIQREVQKGRIKEVINLPPSYFCSPIGLVPKTINGVQSGWRVIFDLSCPDGASVNDGIPSKHGTITYETLNDAIRLVA